MTETETELMQDVIAEQLFACAAEAGNSEHKRARLIELPALVLEQAAAIAEGRYQPQPFTVFAVTDPKLREIFAPDCADRLVQQWLVSPTTARALARPPSGSWKRWLANHRAFVAPGVPSPALLQRMQATINSYYGLFAHADTYRLRKHIYQKELGALKRFFLPDGAHYHHLQVKKVWLRMG